jgi:hypothetical protein
MLVFSGRQNPRWRLAPEDARALQAALRKLPRTSGPLEIPERLGYCGMVASNEDQAQPWSEAVVYHEFVVLRFKGRTDYLIDDDRIVENLLLETAKGHVKDAVIESIRAEPEVTGAS